MSPAQARKRRIRLAREELLRLREREKERAEALQRALLSSRWRTYREAEAGRRGHWTRRLLRWIITGGRFE